MLFPAFAEASDGKTRLTFNFKHSVKVGMHLDTVPQPIKPVETNKEKPVPVVIKALPAPRRQAIPVPVKVKVVPVKVIKPKIVKPIIKLLP